MCNLGVYLLEQEICCRRTHQAANHQGDWEVTAEILCILREHHVKLCAICQLPDLPVKSSDDLYTEGDHQIQKPIPNQNL